jgi:hypothetical protein
MIYDDNGDVMQSANLALRPDEQKMLTVTVACVAGQFLRGTPTTNVFVEARAAGDTEWLNIVAPIDLTPYDETDQDFELRFTDTRAGTARALERFRLQVVRIVPPGIDIIPGEIELTVSTIETDYEPPPGIDIIPATIELTGATIELLEAVEAEDEDAAAFLTAAGITDPTIVSAIDDLVIAIKAISSGDVWTNKLKVAYPWVGGTLGAHAVNLRSPGTFNGTVNGTITHNENGVTGDGSTGYIDTGFNQSTDGAEDDEHVSLYSRTDESASVLDVGVTDASSFGTQMFLRAPSVNLAVRSQCQSQTGSLGDGTSLGYFSLNRTGSAGYRVRQNGTNSNITQVSNTAPQNGNFTFLARNRVGSTVTGFSSKNLAWAALGRGLTEAEDGELRTAVQAFQTALSRNV